jgi:NTE family protein
MGSIPSAAKKVALVLSGGGAKGAWQLGCLQHLLVDRRRSYEIMCGVSVGALNASFLAMYPAGQEVESYRELEKIWLSLDTSKIYKKWWPLGDVQAVSNPSVYDSRPLQTLVRTRLKPELCRQSGKKLRIGACSLETGEYRDFDENFADLPSAVLASASYPAMLLPVWIEGQLWTDGGVRDVTPLKTAIDLGAEEIDVVLCSGPTSKVDSKSMTNALKVAERAIGIMGDEIVENDLKVVGAINELVGAGLRPNKREVTVRVIRPQGYVGAPLDFSPAKIRAMMAAGYEDACMQYAASLGR